MQRGNGAFFGLAVVDLLVGKGELIELPQKPVDGKKPRGEKYTTHTTLAVHGQMFFEIQMNYSVLPDPETMSANKIATYYRAIQKSLLRLSKVET